MSWIAAALGLGVDARDLTLTHVLVRTFVVFFYVLALLRVAKRRFLAQKDPLDILLAILLASMISRAINGSAPFGTSLASGLLLVLLHRALTRLCWVSPAVERFVKGTVDVLVRDGEVQRAVLDHHALSEQDFAADLRLEGGTNDASTLACARLERNGRVSVEKKPAA
jgi:uncharacterized membrane protein YcaP (DUF421 family)